MIPIIWNSYDCLNFTTETATAVVCITGLLGAFTIITNLFAIGVIIYSKRRKPNFTFRLVLYLMTTDILQVVATIMEVLPGIVVPSKMTPAQVRSGRGWINFLCCFRFYWHGHLVDGKHNYCLDCVVFTDSWLELIEDN